VALAIRFQNDAVSHARVVLSGAAPVPWRSKEIETAIVGTRLDADIIEKASASSMKNASTLSQNDYKIPLFRGMIEEELTAMSKTIRINNAASHYYGETS
jgi:xanthine dehydrogenase YagS FAD-binding subunit